MLIDRLLQQAQDRGDSLGRMPLDFDWVAHKPYIARRSPLGVTHRELAALSHQVPVTQQSLGDLVGTQEDVSVAGVQRYLVEPDSKQPGYTGSTGALLDRPLVVQFRNVLYLHDGHHRVTALRMRGIDKAEVRVVNLDARRLGAWATSRGSDEAPQD